MHGDRRLLVFGGRENLRRTRRYRRVFLNQLGHHTAEGLYPQRQRGHIEEQYILDPTAQNTGLYRRTDGNRFVGVDIFARLFAEKFGDAFLHQRHTRLPAD